MLFAKPRNTPDLIVHADDFGITPEQSQLLLDCSSACGGQGALNSLSVLVGSPHFRQCAAMLHPFEDKVLIGLHVNVVEGSCTADASDIPMLVDEHGVFKMGFGGMLLASVLHSRELREQLVCEVGAQLDAFLEEFPGERDHVRIDSHQHFHMIPAVFDAVLASLDSRVCSLEYMRVPFEPFAPFAKSGALGKVLPINWVKHFVLNGLWRLNKGKVPELGKRAGVFCGINFSGHMTAENVSRVLNAFKKHAVQHARPLELLFHPGGVEDGRACLNPKLDGFVAFYTSPLRRREAEALAELEQWL